MSPLYERLTKLLNLLEIAPPEQGTLLEHCNAPFDKAIERVEKLLAVKTAMKRIHIAWNEYSRNRKVSPELDELRARIIYGAERALAVMADLDKTP